MTTVSRRSVPCARDASDARQRDEPAERREAARVGVLAERLEQPTGGEQHEQRAENDRESRHRGVLIWRSFRFYASHGSRLACQ
jgi:hypothetical protein